jgi:hypothetical protein
MKIKVTTLATDRGLFIVIIVVVPRKVDKVQRWLWYNHGPLAGGHALPQRRQRHLVRGRGGGVGGEANVGGILGRDSHIAKPSG